MAVAPLRMTEVAKKIEIPNDFKQHADQLFAQLNEYIDDVNGRIAAISRSISDLENKLMKGVEEGAGEEHKEVTGA